MMLCGGMGAFVYDIYLFSSRVSECVPDSSNFAAGSDSSLVAEKLRELLQKSSEELREMFNTTSMTSNNNMMPEVPELAEVGLRIGDRVMVGGVKVRISVNSDPIRSPIYLIVF